MNVKEVKLTIRCAVHHMPVSGGVTKALAVAKCESGFAWYAKNPSSSASGVYQIVSGTWHSWTYHFRKWRHKHHISAYVFSGRSNVMVAIRAAHEWGWSAWSC